MLDTPHFDNRLTRELPADLQSANFRHQVHGVCYSRVAPTPVASPRLITYAPVWRIIYIMLNNWDMGFLLFIRPIHAEAVPPPEPANPHQVHSSFLRQRAFGCASCDPSKQIQIETNSRAKHQP